MKAAISSRYGSADVIEIGEVPKPVPQVGEVLVKVHATTVTRTDRETLRAHPFFVRLMTGLFRPRNTILGMDFAGVIETVGPGVSRFAPGDRVFGIAPDGCGAHAEFLSIPENGDIESMPAALQFEDVVVCEGAWYAESNLRRCGLKPGQEILIYGASGAIGTASVQLAKAKGAKVTAIVATRHLELVKSLGADRVIDYTAEDYTQIGEAFDFVFDAVGKTTYFKCRNLLKPGGVFSATDLGPWWQNIFLVLWSSITRSGRVVIPIPKNSKALVASIKTLLEQGKFRAVIDRRYPFLEIADAYRYVATCQKTGIVVIDMEQIGNGAEV
jgi:NADPH:quinone reductase-like Zn-dependent oxidoreductase